MTIFLDAEDTFRQSRRKQRKETAIANKTNLVSELQSFYDDGYITGVPRLLKSGKEATVYCCRADGIGDAEWVAAKIYRPLHSRSFKNDSVYREGRHIVDARLRRAVENKSRKGRGTAFGMWIGQEFETLRTLHTCGADVPRPLASAGSAILMEYFGDEQAPAPQLGSIALAPQEAPRLYRQILRNIELWLSCHLVHGDLSAYNILYWKGEAKIIDFPQAVDAMRNANAFALFQRDIANITDYFVEYGVSADPARIARSLWGRYRRNEL